MHDTGALVFTADFDILLSAASRRQLTWTGTNITLVHVAGTDESAQASTPKNWGKKNNWKKGPLHCCMIHKQNLGHCIYRPAQQQSNHKLPLLETILHL